MRVGSHSGDPPSIRDGLMPDRALKARMWAGCPVQRECLELEFRTAGAATTGVWGGPGGRRGRCRWRPRRRPAPPGPPWRSPGWAGARAASEGAVAQVERDNDVPPLDVRSGRGPGAERDDGVARLRRAVHLPHVQLLGEDFGRSVHVQQSAPVTA